jgi:hypothetical protein
MHFHLPKPLHGWREFVGEIAIIVIGVLIALAAEQLVEEWTWGRKVAAAEQSMNDEIKNSLLAVTEMDRLNKCSTEQLEALQAAIERGDQTKARQILDSGYAFGATRQWADNAFEATLAAQVSDHLGAEKLKRYSQVYQMIRSNRRVQDERDDSPELAMLYFMPTLPSSPERRYRQLREVADARLHLLSMRSRGEPLARYAKKDLGLQVTEREYLAAPGRADIIKQCNTGAAQAKS